MKIGFDDFIENLSNSLTHLNRTSNGPPQAGVLVPFYKYQGLPYLLLTERSPQLRTHSGQIAFPGGTREDCDHDIVDTALRECQEEVGIQRDAIQILGKFHDFATPYYQSVTPIVATFDYPYEFVIQESEIARILHVPFHELLEKAVYHNEIWEYEAKNYTLHFYDWVDQSGRHNNIWGATGEVIHKLLGILYPEDNG